MLALGPGHLVRGEEPVEKASWPLFRGDENMQGVSPDSLAPPLAMRWDFSAEDPVPATAVIAAGRVFVGSLDEQFYALDLASGEKLWAAPSRFGVEGAACVVDELVCFGDADGVVYGLDRKTGAKRWSYETGDAIVGGTNYYRAKDGRVFILVGSDDFFLHAIDAKTGNGVWKVETGNYIRGAPSVDAKNRLVIFGGCDEILRLIDAETGELAKEIQVGAYMANSCSVRDGVAYLAHYAGSILAIDLKSGEKRWEHETGGVEFVASPAVTADLVIVAGRDKKLRALERETGEEVWSFTARRGLDSSPVVTAGGAVFVGSDDGRIYAIGLKDGKEKWSYDLGARINSSPAIAEGVLVIGAQDGGVYAFEAKEDS